VDLLEGGEVTEDCEPVNDDPDCEPFNDDPAQEASRLRECRDVWKAQAESLAAREWALLKDIEEMRDSYELKLFRANEVVVALNQMLAEKEIALVTACREHREASFDDQVPLAALEDVRAALSRGDASAAFKQLDAVIARYGPMASRFVLKAEVIAEKESASKCTCGAMPGGPDPCACRLRPLRRHGHSGRIHEEDAACRAAACFCAPYNDPPPPPNPPPPPPQEPDILEKR
jgi:hypothetical protein